MTVDEPSTWVAGLETNDSVGIWCDQPRVSAHWHGWASRGGVAEAQGCGIRIGVDHTVRLKVVRFPRPCPIIHPGTTCNDLHVVSMTVN